MSLLHILCPTVNLGHFKIGGIDPDAIPRFLISKQDALDEKGVFRVNTDPP